MISMADVRSEIYRTLQSQGIFGAFTPGSIPQNAVNLPITTTFPRNPQDGTTAFILDATNATLAQWKWVKSLNKWVRVNAPAAYVTSLPSAPADGTEVVYVADAANGVAWHLRYDSTEPTYKWRFIGGPPLFNEVTTVGSRAVNTYGALASAGPSITLPLTGDYVVTIGCQMQVATAALTDAYMSYSIGGTGAADADALYFAAQNQFEAASPTRSRVKTGLGAVALVGQYKAPSAVQMNFSNRWMSVLPVRVN